jgi:hypothetical protein
LRACFRYGGIAPDVTVSDSEKLKNNANLNIFIKANTKMKKFLLSIIVSSVALITLNATAATPPGTGPLTISWKVSQGSPYLEFVTNKTTIIKKGTNDIGTNMVSSYSGAITTSTFDNGSLLDLLGYSFGTSFKGDALAIDLTNGLYVVKGTNVITNVSSVVSVVLTNGIVSGAATYGQTVETKGTNGPKTTYTGSATQTITSYVKVTYNDTSLVSSNASLFRFVGIATTVADSSVNKTDGAESFSENFTLSDGAGTGTIMGTTSIIKGSITGGPLTATEP